YRLLVPGDTEGGHEVTPAASFWAAMRTIVIADAVMGLDNVLGVAGAAQGSALLVVLGLLISIPIMVCGSTLVLRLLERVAFLVYLGGAVLAWTAAKMILGEPRIAELVAPQPLRRAGSYVGVVVAVLGAAALRNRKMAREATP